ncbi:MAG: HAD family hydrolase [Oscillospiraceae bacterium]|nr:HAD family hydrolase [Oscillospiraceae bacterium]
MPKAILFDLDGTLLPMNMQEFTTGYFGDLADKLGDRVTDRERFVKAIWAGTKAMMANDGSARNEVVFWEAFNALSGIDESLIRKDCDEFYAGEFQRAQRFTRPNPLAVAAVAEAREKADRVVLATNPLFPMTGQRTRLSWIGLTTEDFDLVTSYETDCFCKPNPAYFDSVCRRIGVAPEDCLMIGNDDEEDGRAGKSAGLEVYLVTDCRIPSEVHPWTGAHGSFSAMLDMLRSL